MRDFTIGHGETKKEILDPIFGMPRHRMKPEITFEKRYEQTGMAKLLVRLFTRRWTHKLHRWFEKL